jgi:hypothetical protein
VHVQAERAGVDLRGTDLDARGKKPVARLVPMDVPAYVLHRRAFGVLKGKLKLPDSFFFDPLPEEELELWEKG